MGTEVSFRAGLLTRRASLMDLSVGGCRLHSDTPVEEGKRLRVQIPEALDTGEPFTLTGRVVRVTLDIGIDDEPIYQIGLQFDRVGDDARAALAAVIEDRAVGPATLRPSAALAHKPTVRTSPSSAPSEIEAAAAAPTSDAFDAFEVEMGLEPDLEVGELDASAWPDPCVGDAPRPDAESLSEAEEAQEASEQRDADRRRGNRVDYPQNVPAFGKRALRVLVGRDLSLGGMRIEPLTGLELGDRLHLAVYGDHGEAPFLVWGTVARDDGELGLGLVFDPVEPAVATRLERIVGDLPSVEDLRDDEVEAMGTVVSEILER